jgi:WD40 repeat protein
MRVQAGHGVAVHELRFTNGGKLLASAGADGTVRLWNGSTGAPVKSLPVGTVNYTIAISPDGKRLVSGGFDGLVRMWDVESGRQLASLLSLPSAEGERWLLWTPEGYAEAADVLKKEVVWRMSGQPAENDLAWKSLGRPEMLQKALAGESISAPKFEK